MKKTIFASTLIAIVTLSACSKIRDLFPAFNTNIPPIEVTVPPSVAVGIETSFSNTVNFNLDSAIKAHTANVFGVDALTSVKVKNIKVEITNADALNDLSNFETLGFKFSSNTEANPAEIVTATIPNTPASVIDLPTDNCPELKTYLKGSALTFTATTKTRKVISKSLNALITVTLAIK